MRVLDDADDTAALKKMRGSTRRLQANFRWLGVKRLTNSSAFSATSFQPASIVSACPRPGILTISVTPVFRLCFLYDAFAIAHGTVWSESAETISIGPRSRFFVSTFASDHGLKFADAAWKIGSPGPGTEHSSYSLFASSSSTTFAKLYRNCSKVSG